MKLYITLDNEKGNKIERIIKVDETEMYFTQLNDIGNEMYETICEKEIFDSSKIDIAPDDESLRPSVSPPMGVKEGEAY